MKTPSPQAALSPRRRSFTAAAAALAAAVLPVGATRAQPAAGKPNKVVLQVSDADPHKWTLALSNAYNVQNGVGADSVDLEVVVYGPGIGMLKNGSAVADRVASAMKSGIRVVACENTMAAQKLTPADMLPNIGYVPAGVVELMQKQQQGYAYIRP
jgi:intracellular sulfur oxidation DsrE/DsrF family protein